MDISDLIEQMHDLFGRFNPAATDDDLRRLQIALGTLPNDIVMLYRNHDGAENEAPENSAYLPARLLPVAEAIEANREIDASLDGVAKAGEIAWLWTDDNSNYVGVYTEGALRGWLVTLDHEDRSLVPAYRSVPGFLHRLIASAPGVADPDGHACDVVMIPRELPVIRDDPTLINEDRRLVAYFHDRAAEEDNADLRRFYATCAICLTPVADTGSVLPLLSEQDTWLPESAVGLLQLRGYRGGIDEVERLAREGRTNGDTAAIRHLMRLDTDEARAAVERLKTALSGHKLAALQWDITNRHRFPPFRWH